MLTTIVGCAGGLNAEKTDYRKMPGSGDRMADGPGLLSRGQTDYEDGYTIYSDDPSKQALIHPDRSSETTAAGTGRAESVSTVPTQTQRTDFKEFQEFQQYKKFQQLPEDSAEYQQFRDWQEWKQYQQWRNRGNDEQ